MSQAVRNAGVISLFFMLAGCMTTVRDIQATPPIRTAKFTGAPRPVAACIQGRIGGKLSKSDFVENNEDQFILYDTVRGLSSQGLSHYSMTITKTGSDQGTVEWRIVNAMAPATSNPPPLAEAMVQRFWVPAQECAQRAKGAN